MKKHLLFIFIFILLLDARSQGQSPTPRQLRAFWVDAVPGHNGLKTPAQIDQVITDAKRCNLNALFIQVWRQGGALFLKTNQPRYQDATLQADFDALQYAIDKAHAERIEVHAWINACSIWSGTTAPFDPNHAFNLHGTGKTWRDYWLSRTDTGAESSADGYFLDPGNPAVAEFLAQLYLSVVQNYEVDGIHFDFIRYPGREWGYNPISVERFNKIYNRTGTPAKNDPQWMQWRRDQVTTLVRRVYLSAIQLKPRLKVSAATIAFGSGPTTESAWQNTDAYSSVFQDWRAWTEEGIIDFPVVMNYDREADANQKLWFDQWIEWDKNHRYNRHIVIGQGAFLNSLDETLTQARRVVSGSTTGSQADGICFFSYAVTNKESRPNAEFFNALTTGSSGQAPLFAAPVALPEMNWKTNPQNGNLIGKVEYLNGTPVDGAKVQILRQGADLSAALQRETDGTGYYGVMELPVGNYFVNIDIDGQAVIRNSIIDSVAGLVSGLYITLLDVPTPVIRNVTYRKKTLTITGENIGVSSLAGVRVEINNVLIDREVVSESNTELTIKGKAKQLKLKNGEPNQVVVIVGTKRSAAFTF